MNIFRQIRRGLALKLFLSYFIVIFVGVIVLTTAAEFAVPGSFERHLAAMSSTMAGRRGETSSAKDLNADLFLNFRLAVNEALIFAAIASSMAAIIVSFFFQPTHRLTDP